MSYIYIKATAQAEGDLHLSDSTNWGVSKCLLKVIRVETSSTDWDLYVLQNDNGYVTNDANVPMIQVVDAGNGNTLIHLDLPYVDEDNSNEVHLYYLDNSGSNAADIYIFGDDREVVANIMDRVIDGTIKIEELFGILLAVFVGDMTESVDGNTVTYKDQAGDPKITEDFSTAREVDRTVV